MVEEYLEFRGSEIVQNKNRGIYFLKGNPSPWLKKILNFEALNWSKTKILTSYFERNPFPMVEENFEFRGSEMVQDESF